MKLIPISRVAHHQTRVRGRTTFENVRHNALLPVFGAELSKAAHEFPICFTQDAGGFFPTALLAVEGQQNLFVAPDGKWLGGYLPAVLRRDPFALARVEETEDWVLCLDEESDLVSPTEGNPLFGDDGQPARMITDVTNFLVELERNRAATSQASRMLAEHGLLEPWDLKIARESGGTRKIDGLFVVGEARLAAVPADVLVALRDCGALTIAYAQLFSLAKLPVLGRLATLQGQLARQGRPIGDALDLDRVFGIGEDDPFEFNFT